MVFAEVVDFLVAWLLACLPTLWYCFTLYILSLLFKSGLAELKNVSQWCGKMKGLVGGLCREEKTSLCIRCNPKLCIEFQTFVLRENFVYVWDNNLGALGFGHYESAITHFLFFTFVSEICSVAACGCRLKVAACGCKLKVKPRKFLMFFLVCVLCLFSHHVFFVSIPITYLVISFKGPEYFHNQSCEEVLSRGTSYDNLVIELLLFRTFSGCKCHEYSGMIWHQTPWKRVQCYVKHLGAVSSLCSVQKPTWYLDTSKNMSMLFGF